MLPSGKSDFRPPPNCKSERTVNRYILGFEFFCTRLKCFRRAAHSLYTAVNSRSREFYETRVARQRNAPPSPPPYNLGKQSRTGFSLEIARVATARLTQLKLEPDV